MTNDPHFMPRGNLYADAIYLRIAARGQRVSDR
jgi:hypothetical protein